MNQYDAAHHKVAKKLTTYTGKVENIVPIGSYRDNFKFEIWLRGTNGGITELFLYRKDNYPGFTIGSELRYTVGPGSKMQNIHVLAETYAHLQYNREQLLNRRVALDAAVTHCSANRFEFDTGDVIDTADIFFTWLMHGELVERKKTLWD